MNDRIGRYEIRSRLGSGAFATVCEAFDPRLESVVAIKLLADNWIHEPEVRARFRQEAVLMRRIHTEHPSAPLVEVYDIDETSDGRPYFVMRLAEHGSLSDRTQPGQRWAPEAVGPVVEVLANSLTILHRAGVVHRDVKPSNLLVAAGGSSVGDGTAGALVGPGERLLLGDLGLAKDLLVSGSALTMAGGTPRFMAPEQRDPAAVIDHRADLYAATAVVADLLTGSPAPDGVEPAEVRRVFERDLSVDPARRHADATAWADDMQRALRACRDASSPPAPPSRPSQALPAQIPLSSPHPTHAVAGPPADPGAPSLATAEQPPNASGPGRRIPVGALVAAAVAAVLAVIVAVLLTLDQGSGSEAIVGPRQVSAGETITLVADVDAEDSFTWIVGGRRIDDLDLELTPVRAGFVVVALEVTDADGTLTESSARITVTE